jgi:hypothetical protein
MALDDLEKLDATYGRHAGGVDCRLLGLTSIDLGWPCSDVRTWVFRERVG